jgi:hypothetical protein
MHGNSCSCSSWASCMHQFCCMLRAHWLADMIMSSANNQMRCCCISYALQASTCILALHNSSW